VIFIGHKRSFGDKKVSTNLRESDSIVLVVLKKTQCNRFVCEFYRVCEIRFLFIKLIISDLLFKCCMGMFFFLQNSIMFENKENQDSLIIKI